MKRKKVSAKTTEKKISPVKVKTLLVVIGLVLAVGLFYQIRSYAINLNYFMFNPKDLSLAAPPDWVTPDIEKEVFNIPSLKQPFSLLEPEIARKIGKELEEIPWIKTVHAVRKYFPRKLEVEISLRKPVAWAQKRQVLYLIDADGVRLPRQCRAQDVKPISVPVIANVKGEIPEIGLTWNDEGLKAGLAVANLLDYSENPVVRRVASIEPKITMGQVSNVIIYTSGNSAILWGKPPYAKNTMEQTTEVKMQHLLGLLTHFDEKTLAGYDEIDIRYYKSPRARRRIPGSRRNFGVHKKSLAGDFND